MERMTAEQALADLETLAKACNENHMTLIAQAMREPLDTLRAELADMREELDATIDQRDLLSQEVLRLEGKLDGLREKPSRAYVAEQMRGLVAECPRDTLTKMDYFEAGFNRCRAETLANIAAYKKE